jgi:hypothetical protein
VIRLFSRSHATLAFAKVAAMDIPAMTNWRASSNDPRNSARRGSMPASKQARYRLRPWVVSSYQVIGLRCPLRLLYVVRLLPSNCLFLFRSNSAECDFTVHCLMAEEDMCFKV